MKYFTIDVWRADGDLEHMGEASEGPIAEYKKYLESVEHLLPRGYRTLKERVYLQDSMLKELSANLTDGSAVLNLMYCTRHDEAECHTRIAYSRVESVTGSLDLGEGEGPVPKAGEGLAFYAGEGVGDLGFDEIEVLGEGRFEHRILFGSGFEIAIVFGDLSFELEASGREHHRSPASEAATEDGLELGNVERGVLLYDEANEAVEMGEKGYAEGLFQESWEANPTFEAAESLGRLMKERGSVDEALLWLSASIGLRSRPGAVRLQVAELLAGLGDLKGARAQVQKALEEEPGLQEAKALAAEFEKRGASASMKDGI